MNWIEQIVTALLKFLHGLASADTTAEDAKSDPDLARRLRERIDAHERGVRDPGDHGASR